MTDARKQIASPRVKWLLVLGVIVALVLFSFLHPPTRDLLGTLKQWVLEQLVGFVGWTQGMGVWGPVLLALFYILACILFLPGSILTLGAGLAFGLVTGFITVSVGSVVGACAAFLLGRTVLRGWMEKKISAYPRFKAIDEAVGQEGFKIVLLTRLSPVFPFNFLNYAFGITRVSFRDYFLASWIGMIPGTVMYVYLGTALKSVAELLGESQDVEEGAVARRILLGVGLVATVVVTVFITRIARRALKKAIQEEGR